MKLVVQLFRRAGLKFQKFRDELRQLLDILIR